VTTNSLDGIIAERAAAAGMAVEADVLSRSASYLSLLSRWNRRINLTALPLTEPMADAAVDKLVIEPLVAASMFPTDAANWFDLGSGGGSPAIPLRLVRPAGSLTMVESRERKCAFLREAVRTLKLDRTTVLAARFEELPSASDADVITLRAVRIDRPLVELLARLLRVNGLVFCFGSALEDDRFALTSDVALPDSSRLFVYRVSRT